MVLTAGIDLGGSKISAVLLKDNTEVIASTRMPTLVNGPDDICHLIERVVQKLADSVSVNALDALGIGMAGVVDNSQGTVAHAVNLPTGDKPLEIGSFLEDRFQALVNVENDVNASAFGAYQNMAIKEGIENLVYLSIGTGIAAGIVLDGRIYRGARGVAGEIGHLPVAPDGPGCGCGLHGCFEAVASGSAIDRLWPVAGTHHSAFDLFAANRIDQQATAVVESVTSHIAHAVYLLALVVDVEVFLLGGGVTDIGLPFFNAVEASLERLAQQSTFVRHLDLHNRVRPSPGNQIGAIGAAAAAAQRLASTPKAHFAA